MKLFIGLIIGFLVIVYIYSFLKIRKRRKNNINTLDAFHKSYDKIRLTTDRKLSNLKNSEEIMPKKFITKYNSPLDYYEKEKTKSKDPGGL